MNYKDRAKSRRLKKDILSFLSIFKFKASNIKIPGKIVLFGIIISLIGLFSPWILDLENKLYYNSFSESAGNIGTTALLSIIILLFIVLSINNKEKVKRYFGIQIKDYLVVIVLGIFITILELHSIVFIKSLLFFSKDIELGKGVILSITGSLIIVGGGILMKKDFNKKSISSLNESEKNTKNIIMTNSNMKLPF